MRRTYMLRPRWASNTQPMMTALITRKTMVRKGVECSRLPTRRLSCAQFLHAIQQRVNGLGIVQQLRRGL